MMASWSQEDHGVWSGTIEVKLDDELTAVRAKVCVGQITNEDADTTPVVSVQDRERLEVRDWRPMNLMLISPWGWKPSACEMCRGAGRYVCLPGDETTECPGCGGTGLELSDIGRRVAELLVQGVER